MAKNKVRTRAKAKGKRLAVPIQSNQKITAQATVSTQPPSHTKNLSLSAHSVETHVIVSPSNYSTSHTATLLTPSQMASSLTVPLGVSGDALLTLSSLRATNSGSASSCILGNALSAHSGATSSHHTSSTIPATEQEQATADTEQQSPHSEWEKCSTDALGQWAAVADRVYAHASAIFDHAREEKPGGSGLVRYGEKSKTPPCTPAASSAQEQHLAYRLAFNSLKYQELLENVIIGSYMCRAQILPDDLMPLAMVMVFDLVDRKFLPREPMRAGEEEPVEDVRQVEACLLRFKTKLAASLARLRIKQNLLTIADTLPAGVKMQEEREHTLLVHGWVNTLKSSIEDVCARLQAEGFSEVASHTPGTELVFWRDTHCSDVLVFPSHTKAQLVNSPLGREYVLNIQERSRSLAAWAVCPFLVEESEVLMVGSFSALTVAHMAVLASARSARVVVCGLLPNSRQREELKRLLSSVGCRNVKLLSESFLELDEWDMRMQKVRVALLLPQCSTSALSNPVEHIINEDGDRSLLQGLAQGVVSQSKLDALTSKQTQDLSYALSFPKVHAVVYCTCSERDEENELLVQSALEKTGTRPKLIPFRLVTPGVLSGSGAGAGSEQTSLRLEPSEFTNGCFICVLAREPDPSKVESVQDVLARAAAKGLLGGFVALLPTQKEKRRHRSKAPPLSPPPVYLEPHELPEPDPDPEAEPTSPPSPCPVSDSPSGDAAEKVAVSSSGGPQTPNPIRRLRRPRAARPQRGQRKHTSSRRSSRHARASSGPAQRRRSRGPRAPSSEPGVLGPRRGLHSSGNELVTSKQEVMKPSEEVPVCPKDQVTSRHQLPEPKQDALSSKKRFTSTPDALISAGNGLVTSKHHIQRSRGGAVSPELRTSASRREEQRVGQDKPSPEKPPIVSRHDAMGPKHEVGKAQRIERRSPEANPRGQEAVRPVQLVLPPLFRSPARLSPSHSRLLTSSSRFSSAGSPVSSRASSARWNP